MSKVEYLILTKQNGSFCNSIATFLKLLEVDSSIKIEKDTINFQSNEVVTTATFKLKTGEIATKKERYFHLEITNKNENNLDAFSNMNQQIKKTLKRITPDETKINTLWDDIGREYAIKAYPLINEIENLMRKLISQFMLINVGMDWTGQEIHDEIKEKIKRHEQQELYVDDLYKTDFIHLSDVLFAKYRTVSIEEMHRVLATANKNDDLDIATLKKFIPQSNWEKYFASKINYDHKKLEEKWRLLYSSRNHIAHNRYITKEEYYKINGLVNELKVIIIKTIDKLDEINLKEEEKDDVKLAYVPIHPLYKGQIAEKAVANWYLQNYQVKTINENSSNTKGFDFSFVLEDQKKKVAVEVIGQFFTDMNRRISERLYRAEDLLEHNFDEFHLVILSNTYNYSDLNSRLKFNNLSYKTRVKIFIGFLDENGEFILIHEST